MSKIICLLENASNLINGIKFTPAEGVEGLVSEEVSESVAALFLSIPGYVLHGADGEEGDGEQPPLAPAPKPETAAERKARLKREAAEKEAADKAEADRLAAEEAARVADEEEAARKAAEDAANAGDGEGEKDEVF